MQDSPDDVAGLLELFVRKRPWYAPDDAQRLTGVSAEQVARAIDDGEIEPYRVGETTLLAWEDVAFLALERWTPRQIAVALRRAGYPHALPMLNQLRTITIELPAYQIRLLHHLAEACTRDGARPLSVSDVLEYELDALACAEDLAKIDHVIPGFSAAASFPSLHERLPLVTPQCLFCGTAVGSEREACPDCETRHFPAPLRDMSAT